MANFYAPDRIARVEIVLRVNLGGGGEHVREVEFTAERNGAETLAQLADLMLSACDLALSKAAPVPPPMLTNEQRGEIAYQLTRRLAVDISTARGAIDDALLKYGDEVISR